MPSPKSLPHTPQSLSRPPTFLCSFPLASLAPRRPQQPYSNDFALNARLLQRLGGMLHPANSQEVVGDFPSHGPDVSAFDRFVVDAEQLRSVAVQYDFNLRAMILQSTRKSAGWSCAVPQRPPVKPRRSSKPCRKAAFLCRPLVSRIRRYPGRHYHSVRRSFPHADADDVLADSAPHSQRAAGPLL